MASFKWNEELIKNSSLDEIKDVEAKTTRTKYYHQMQVLASKYPDIKKNTFVFR